MPESSVFITVKVVVPNAETQEHTATANIIKTVEIFIRNTFGF
jgi:hypothetical protein